MHSHPRAAGRHAQGYRRTWSSPRLGLAALFQRGALAGALTGIHDPKRRLGVMSIARQGGAFESGHRELFRYLVGQASISVENVDLHELVSEQAITTS